MLAGCDVSSLTTHIYREKTSLFNSVSAKRRFFRHRNVLILE